MPQNSRLKLRPASYSWAQIVLHWTIAVLVVWQLFFSGRPRFHVTSTTTDLWSMTSQSSHVWVGLLILLLVAIRIALRLVLGAPPADDSNRLAATAARGAHFLFYALLLFMPITGILAYYGGLPVGGLHEAGQPVFVALIAVHAAAALWHQFVKRDGLMRRMLAPAH